MSTDLCRRPHVHVNVGNMQVTHIHTYTSRELPLLSSCVANDKENVVTRHLYIIAHLHVRIITLNENGITIVCNSFTLYLINEDFWRKGS